MSHPSELGASVVPAEFARGVNAVLPAGAPPLVVVPVSGWAGWNPGHHEIRVDPQVTTWPADAQRFLGAHEAAHVEQAMTTGRCRCFMTRASLTRAWVLERWRWLERVRLCD